MLRSSDVPDIHSMDSSGNPFALQIRNGCPLPPLKPGDLWNNPRGPDRTVALHPSHQCPIKYFEMHQAGFKCTGNGDKVHCIECDIVLDGRCLKGDLFEMHALNCPFIRRVKGENFLKKARLRFLRKVTEEKGCNVDSLRTELEGLLEKSGDEMVMVEFIDNLLNTLQTDASVEDLKEKIDALLCKVCFDRDTEVVHITCYHVVCCASCSDELSFCPVCRKEIEDRGQRDLREGACSSPYDTVKEDNGQGRDTGPDEKAPSLESLGVKVREPNAVNFCLEAGGDVPLHPEHMDPVGTEHSVDLEKRIQLAEKVLAIAQYSEQSVQEALDVMDKRKELQKQLRTLRDKQLCKICMEREMEVIFLPCKHLMCCASCSTAMCGCAICGVTIERVEKVYFA